METLGTGSHTVQIIADDAMHGIMQRFACAASEMELAEKLSHDETTKRSQANGNGLTGERMSPSK